MVFGAAWVCLVTGDVYYSPRYNDDRYTYRHVLLTNGVRKEAERVAATVPGALSVCVRLGILDS